MHASQLLVHLCIGMHPTWFSFQAYLNEMCRVIELSRLAVRARLSGKISPRLVAPAVSCAALNTTVCVSGPLANRPPRSGIPLPAQDPYIQPGQDGLQADPRQRCEGEPGRSPVPARRSGTYFGGRVLGVGRMFRFVRAVSHFSPLGVRDGLVLISYVMTNERKCNSVLEVRNTVRSIRSPETTRDTGGIPRS